MRKDLDQVIVFQKCIKPHPISPVPDNTPNSLQKVYQDDTNVFAPAMFSYQEELGTAHFPKWTTLLPRWFSRPPPLDWSGWPGIL